MALQYNQDYIPELKFAALASPEPMSLLFLFCLASVPALRAAFPFFGSLSFFILGVVPSSVAASSPTSPVKCEEQVSRRQ